MSSFMKLAKNIIFSTKSTKNKREKPIEDYYDHWEPTSSEKEMIRLTWSNDFDFLFTLGSNIYVYIFDHNPKAKALFPSIHQHGDKWQESKEFRRIALVLAQSVDFAIKNIYHMDEVAEYFYRLGGRHSNHVARGFKPEYWDIVPDSIESSVAPKLAGSDFNDEQKQEIVRVWRRLGLYIINHMRRCSSTFTDTDIPGNDLSAVEAPISDCLSICKSTSGCKAFVWNSTNSGTCYLKTAASPLVSASNQYAGISTQDPYCSTIFSNRAITGNTIAFKLGQLGDCCNYCEQTSGCKAFTWDNTGGGTCWLKSEARPLASKSGSQTSILLPGSAENCTKYWDNEPDAHYYSVTQKYYFVLSMPGETFQYANQYCTAVGGDVASIHSSAENNFITQLCVPLNANAYIGFYAPNGPPGQPVAGWTWTDGTSINYTNWNNNEPNNYGGDEITVILNGDQAAGCFNNGWSNAMGRWIDVNPYGNVCAANWVVCQVQCGTSQFPIDDQCPFSSSEVATLKQQMTQPNFNSDILTIIMAAYPVELRSNMSWKINDMFVWAAYERTELNLTEDFVSWTDSSMGNCFTFNHINSSKIDNLRYPGEFGGFKARMKIHQDQYLEWSYTASLLIFFHSKEEVINGDSVSYNIASGEEATFRIKRKDYTRLDPPYGRCIHDKSEVKSFYSGGVYNVDGCFQSCYQDYVYKTCDCMDPRYASKDNTTLCTYPTINCFMNITLVRGEPSTWPECRYCLPPCKETKFEVSWSKTIFRYQPTECNPNNKTMLANNQTVYDNCTAQFLNEFAIFSAYMVQYGHYVFAETPTMTLNDVFNSFNNLTGLLLGLAMVSFFEFIYLFIWICYSMKKHNNQNHPRRHHL